MQVLSYEQKQRILKELSQVDGVKITYGRQGYASFIPWSHSMTGPRKMMGLKAFDTAMSLLEYDLPITTTGVHVPMADGATIIKMPRDGVVVKIINSFEARKLYYDVNGKLYLITVRDFIKTHEKYGVPLYFTDEFLSLRPGDIVREGTILANSHQVDRGMLTFFRNLYTVVGSFNQNSEDSIVISESAAKKLRYYTFPQVVLNINKDDVLLNINGDTGSYKPIPELYSHIRKDGAIIAKRNIESIMSTALLTDEALMEFDENFDEILYSQSGGGDGTEVVGVEVINTVSNTKMPEIMSQIMNIIQRRIKVSKECTKLVNKYREHDISVIKDENYNYLLDNVRNLSFKASPIHIRITITIKKLNPLSVKPKLYGEFGNKGIVCGIVPDEDMPLFEDGVRAEVLVDPSVVNRNNSPMITVSGGTNTIARKIRNSIRAKLGYSPNEGYIYGEFEFTKKLYDFARREILDFLEIIESPLYESYLQLNEEEFCEIIEEVIRDEFRVVLPPPHVSPAYILSKIEGSRFALKKMKATANLGHSFEFEDGITYTVAHMLVQSKLGDVPMGVSCPFENHYNLPTSLTGYAKATRQCNYKAIRFLTAADMRFITSYVETDAMIDFIESGKDPAVRNYMYGTMLRAENSSDIEDTIDRSLIPYGKDPFTLLYQSLTKTVGYIPVNVDEGYLEWDKMDDDFRAKKFTTHIEGMREI